MDAAGPASPIAGVQRPATQPPSSQKRSTKRSVGTRQPTASALAASPSSADNDKAKPTSSKTSKKAGPSSSSSREQQAGQPSAEGSQSVMTSGRESGHHMCGRGDRTPDVVSDHDDGSSTSSSSSHGEGSSHAASYEDADNDSSSSSSLASRKEAPAQRTAHKGEAKVAVTKSSIEDAYNRFSASALLGSSSIANEEESSSHLVNPKPWLTTEEYLPSSCSSSDAEMDDSDDDDYDDSDADDETSFACSSASTSSSSASSSFLDDDDGIEYVEYFTGDAEERRSVVFLHMPPQQLQGQGRAHPKPATSSAAAQPNMSPAVLKRNVAPGPAPDRPAAIESAAPPALALREPVGAGRPPNNPKEINIRPSDLLSQIQEMPPLVDLVEVDESDDDFDDTDSGDESSGSSDDNDCEDESSDESSIDESDYRDILLQQHPPGKAFHMPPERAQSAAFLNATKIGPPPRNPQPPPTGPVPVGTVTRLPPRPTVAAPTTAAPAKAPRIPMELQAVFLASQQGEVVDKPPTSGAAFRVFGSWFGLGSSSRNNNANEKRGGAAPRLLPAMLQRRQQSARHPEDQPLQQSSNTPPSSSLQGGGASRKIAQFFRSKQLRKQPSSSSFRRMPQLPEISEVSCSMDASVVDPTTSHSAGGVEMASNTEVVGRARTPSSPVRRSFSVRSFGSSRKSSVGSAVSSSSAASANSSSAASPQLRKGGINSRGSQSRQGQREIIGALKDGSLCSQSCKSRITENSRGSSHPVASIGSSGIDDDDDDSSHSWDSDVSDLSSEDEALYADLEQMLSQAKATFTSKKGLPTPDIGRAQHHKGQATPPSAFTPTVPSFIQNSKQPPTRPPSAQVTVYVPASPLPTRPRVAPRPGAAAASDNVPITPVFGGVANRQPKGPHAFEPTIPSFSEKRIKKAQSATSFASSQASRPAPTRAPTQVQPTSAPLSPPPKSSLSSRIPLELQEIFLRSNAGENVEEILPPNNGNAFKVFAKRSGGSVWPSILRRNPSRRPLLVPSKSKRMSSVRKVGGSRDTKADQSVQSFTGNTAESSSPLSLSGSPLRAPKEIVYVPRIPEELQEIFVQSNRGHEVHQPPRSGSAFKVFEKRVGDRDLHVHHHQPMTLNRLYQDWRVHNSAT